MKKNFETVDEKINDEQKLLKYFSQLDTKNRQKVLEFAEFIAQKMSQSGHMSESNQNQELQEPQDIPRPKQENVIRALKRLSKTYYMLNNELILGEATQFVSQHIMQGRAAEDVIDDLENLFTIHYEKFKAKKDDAE